MFEAGYRWVGLCKSSPPVTILHPPIQIKTNSQLFKLILITLMLRVRVPIYIFCLKLLCYNVINFFKEIKMNLLEVVKKLNAFAGANNFSGFSRINPLNGGIKCYIQGGNSIAALPDDNRKWEEWVQKMYPFL